MTTLIQYLQQIIPNNTGTAEWDSSSLTNKQKQEIFRLLMDKAKDMVKDQDPGVVLQQLNECYQTVYSPAYEIHEVYFSPEDDCVAAIQKYLDMAQKSVDICVFTITDDRLADPIKDCYHRGLNVRIIADDGKVFDRGSDIFRLSKAGIPIEVDHSNHLMHNKFAIIDKKTVITGSYNWTRSAANKNQENVLITSQAEIVAQYITEFEKLWKQWV